MEAYELFCPCHKFLSDENYSFPAVLIYVLMNTVKNFTTIQL